MVLRHTAQVSCVARRSQHTFEAAPPLTETRESREAAWLRAQARARQKCCCWRRGRAKGRSRMWICAAARAALCELVTFTGAWAPCRAYGGGRQDRYIHFHACCWAEGGPKRAKGESAEGEPAQRAPQRRSTPAATLVLRLSITTSTTTTTSTAATKTMSAAGRPV